MTSLAPTSYANASPSSGSSSRTRRRARAGSGSRGGAGPFASRASTHDRGRQAEAEARRWLRERGYRILHRNYRTRVGEIDVVAEDGGVLCFVEIKARALRIHGPALGAVTPHQRRRVARAAALYVQATGFEGPCRFDVLGMDWSASGWRFDLVRGAFLADGSLP